MNKNKYLSYKEAYNKMSTAMKFGYYLEAIAIQESIISDRLLSFVIGKRLKLKNNTPEKISKVSLNNLIEISKSYMIEKLFNDLDKFRNKRNTCMHSMVKSFPGKPTMIVTDFNFLAKETCEEGKTLTREVLKWHRKQKKTSP